LHLQDDSAALYAGCQKGNKRNTLHPRVFPLSAYY
jgi:hypothetical protein